MVKGQVKWFNNAKGIGFIIPPDDGEDIFVHYSAIKMDGFKTIAANQKVSYTMAEGPKGRFAKDVTLD